MPRFKNTHDLRLFSDASSEFGVLGIFKAYLSTFCALGVLLAMLFYFFFLFLKAVVLAVEGACLLFKWAVGEM